MALGTTALILGLLVVSGARTSLVASAAALQAGMLLAGHAGRRDAERRALESHAVLSRRRFESLVRSSAAMIGICRPDGRIEYISPAVERLLGYTPAEAMAMGAFDIVHPDDVSKLMALAELLVKPGSSAQIDYRVRARDGRWHTFDNVMTNHLDDPAVQGFVWNAHDITDQVEMEQQLRFQAFHDPLTGLANRVLLRERLDHALARSARTDAQVMVVFVDLDGFTSINDSMGHDRGDELLGQVAVRLGELVRDGDTLARLGGDEFALVLEDVDAAGSLVDVAERVLAAVRQPFSLRDAEVFLTASAGVVTARGGAGVDAERLLRDADVAMYAAKSRGRDRVETFEPAMHAEVVQRTELLTALHRALENDELRLQFQPTVDLGSRTVDGVEALVRWEHPTRGTVPPCDFIPAAESSGLIVEIGRWVLRTACETAAAWQRARPEFTLAVNLSVRQLHDPRIVQDVAEALMASGLPASNLVLEITETALTHDLAEALDRLHELKSMGVRLAVDDFGTGYSSLAQLKDLPVDIVKIDKAFVDGLACEAGRDRGEAFVGAIVALARSLGLQTVAEGVETGAQATCLEVIGCDLAQGYHFARPLDADRVDTLLADDLVPS